MAEAEEVNRSLTEKVAALEAERAEERKALSIRTAIEETFEGKPNAERVKKEVSALVAEGLLDSPEAIDVWGNRLLEMASDIVALNTAVAGAAVVEAVDTSDDLVEVSEEEAAGESAPGLLNEDFAAQLKSIIERDRTLQGRV